MVDVPQHDGDELEQFKIADSVDLPPEQQELSAKQFILAYRNFFIQKMKEYENQPENKSLLVADMDRQEQQIINQNAKRNPKLKEVWQGLKQNNVASFSKRSFDQAMTTDYKNELIEKAEERAKFLRVRAAVADDLGAEGLGRFDDAVRLELGR